MSKEKPFENKILAFYKKNAIDLVMFGYVTGCQDTLPSLKTNRCVERFLKKFDLNEDDYSIESALRTYTRILKDYWTSKKTL